METPEEIMDNCFSNQRVLVRNLANYLNENINDIGDDVICDNACGTIVAVADALRELAGIYGAAKRVKEVGELGQISFENLIWKGEEHDRSND